jgi:hypothetical protein
MHAQFSEIDRREVSSRRQMLSTAAFGMLIAVVCSGFTPVVADQAAQPYLGGWDLTIPGGGAGWLGVTEKDDQLKASILWGGGSVVPVTTAKVEDGKLVLTRVQRQGTPPVTTTVTIVGQVDGDTLHLTCEDPGKNDGRPSAFFGKRTPPLPPAPDLSKVKFGDPIVLFNGKDLSGWKVLNSRVPNGWSVQDGVMTNTVVQEKDKPHTAFANLRTEQEFEDFNITLETRVAKGGNSGVYLRGIYEVQVMDSYGKKLDPHNMGAIYSRICPTVAAEKPVGEWQTLDITLVDRHATVILNGTKIIDNQPLLGCTGGALWSDQLRPGPIYLQGDHTGIEYRNIVLRPVVK